tara:strand:- start:2527 stop:3003 length:477 start_codon:yes stop_codon:yes gene_type:complete
MKRNIRTARGSMIDMAALASQNERTRAVGNVPMNARGDRLNEDGTVRVKAEDIAVAHQNMQEPPQQQAISDPKPIEPVVFKEQVKPTPKKTTPKQEKVEPVKTTAPPPEPEMVNLEEQFSQEPEAISKITRTRKDGTKYVEIEYDDGSIETLEINEEE